jgi:hypothetical protein
MLEPGSGGDASMDHGDGTSFASFLTHECRSKMHHLNPAQHDANFWILDLKNEIRATQVQPPSIQVATKYDRS